MMLVALLAQPAQTTVLIQGARPASEAVVGKAAMKYLPMDVPKGVTSIEIVPEIFDGEGDRDTVDLGLFDPNGLGEKGFRGWEGGTRRPARITGEPQTTSPWAIAGPLPPGRWHLAQYYLKASSKGLRYRYTITFRFDGPRPPAKRPLPPPAPDPGGSPGWYVGDLHAHSLSSDGALSLRELAERHRSAGFDFMASTEHNTPGAHWLLADAMRAVPGITLIPGTELTTPGGHANLIGLRPERWIDFRVDPGDGGLPRRFEDAKRQGAMVEINHPFADCTSCTWTFAQDEWRGAHGIEVWNSFWDATDQKALDLWDSMLRGGRRINAYGGSDFHRDPAPLGPAVQVWSLSRRAKDLVEGLKRGTVTVAQSAKGPTLRLTVSCGGRQAVPGETLNRAGTIDVAYEVVGAPGSVLTIHDAEGTSGDPIGIEGDRRSGTVARQAHGFVRLELRKAGGEMLALTNAVYLR